MQYLGLFALTFPALAAAHAIPMQPGSSVIKRGISGQTCSSAYGGGYGRGGGNHVNAVVYPDDNTGVDGENHICQLRWVEDNGFICRGWCACNQYSQCWLSL
ncbi:hypothetical protein GQ53DRAFT_770455 [Thozetella sp. PMI_491]|nr:hypothetical protein GQ53DRAFT_770455 [Thozetella sp. PMI_491]